MLFSDVALAARIEAAECRLSTDIADVLRAKGRDAFAIPFAGGAVVFGGLQTPFNKLIGAGFGAPVDEEGLAEAERAFSERGAAIRAEVSTLADPAIVTTLSGRGYLLVGFEDVLGRPLDGQATPEPQAFAVAEIGAPDTALWLDTVVTGFMTPDTQGVASSESYPREVIEPLVSDMLDAPGYHRYLAYAGDLAVGGGTTRIDGHLAQLCGAATLPGWRRRGVQTALLVDRLRSAAALGCDLAVVTTLPGSKSQENVVRRGFERLYTRAVLVKEP